jgi:hypothetical protein
MKNMNADSGNFGVALAVAMAIIGLVVFASTVGFSKAIYLIKHAF